MKPEGNAWQSSQSSLELFDPLLGFISWTCHSLDPGPGPVLKAKKESKGTQRERNVYAKMLQAD